VFQAPPIWYNLERWGWYIVARNRKKAKSLKVSIKYELYGILILALSVIAISRDGSVARALTYMFRFLIGQTDWLIPLIAIYVGLYVMIKRAWPREWSIRKTGLLFIFLALITMNHMSMFEVLDPAAELRAPKFILSQTWESMVQGFRPSGSETEILSEHIGGGLVGAVLYSMLYFLFGNWGSGFLIYTFFAIGFILFTGISVVDVVSRMRGQASGVKTGLSHRIQEWLNRGKNKSAKGSRAAVRKAAAYVPEDDDELEEETFVPEKRRERKKPVFFQLLQRAERSKQNDVEDGTEDHEVLVAANGSDTGVIQAFQDEPPFAVEEDSSIPVVKDFQDLVDAVPEEPPTAPPAAEPETAAPSLEDPAVPFSAGASVKPEIPYTLPTLQLLSRPAGGGKGGDALDFKANARKLEATLESFGVRAKVLEVVRGPAVTRYEIQPDVGVKVSRIVSLTDDIALALAAKDIRMEAPIPGKSAIGIEVPNMEVSVVTLREVMETGAFQDSAARLTIAFGRDIAGQPIVANLAKMPHLLVAGATGSGKSVCINGIITSILYKAKPDEVKLLMIDPKMVELNVYNGIPHLLAPVVTDPRRASLALKKVVVEMEKRYELFSKSGTRNIEGYNAMITDPNHPSPGEPLPFIVVIVDELADLMMVAAGDVEDSICRLAQMARAAGIHLIIATQRPSVDVITGVIKANIPSRVAFGVSSQVDSRTILDMVGAEKLLGRGDMLFLPVGASKPIRVQGNFLSDQEVESVVNFVRNQGQAEYKEDMVPQIEEQDEAGDEFEDELYDQAVQIVVEAKQASVSLLQRRMRVGYTRAARLIDAMEAKGVVGPYEGSKPREVLVTPEQFYAQNRISS